MPGLQARVIQVNSSGGTEFRTIREAVLHAVNGDSIRVSGHYYHEGNLVIDKSITLFSDENANLDGGGLAEIITVTAPKVKIFGFCILNSGASSTNEIAGVHVKSVHHVDVFRNNFENCFFGILFENTTHCIASNNTIQGNPVDENITGNGIHLWKCDSMKISGNTIHGHRDGIYFEFVTHSSITNNISFENMRYGLHFMFSNDDEYLHNQFSNNGAGVAVMFSRNVNMLYNVFSNNWGSASYGLLLKEISRGSISRNVFESNTAGAYFEGSNNLNLTENVFTRNGWALKIQASCNEVRVDSNNFISNTFDVATNGTLVLNQFHHNYWDKYEGYDLKHDGQGDIPYQPVSLYSMITERNPGTLLLLRSFLVSMLDRAEKVIPSITPEKLKDEAPLMKPLPL